MGALSPPLRREKEVKNVGDDVMRRIIFSLSYGLCTVWVLYSYRTVRVRRYLLTVPSLPKIGTSVVYLKISLAPPTL